ncbi:MAG: NAD(P)H-dependent oxidoreductase subunit E [Burkholderiales bacterium]|nr:NAD(P)H-dependent oxidoreductase subunit E [Burkholderiales bacterium]
MMNQYSNHCVDFNASHVLHRLYEIQHTERHISAESMTLVADEFKMSVSQVASVVSFYSFFYLEPVGRYHIQFSNCTSCGYQVGQLNLLEKICRLLSVVTGKTREDGWVSVGETSCTGMCDHGASMLINGMPLARLDDERITQISCLISEQKPLEQWPVEWFRVESSIQKHGLLLSETLQPGSSLKKVLVSAPQQILNHIIDSGLRGRGGAGFGTGKKWQFCRDATGEARYVVCNADEGEPGTFKDRVLLENNADALFEGMAICAYVIGAKKGYLYLRGEYRYLLGHLQNVLKRRYAKNLLGQSILEQAGFDFDIEIVVGAGAYICGEESALIESLEGKPGIPQIRPPFPVTHGYLGQPTVVNNVETFIAATHIAKNGSGWFKSMGTKESTGSKILSVSGDCRIPGVYEYPYGVSIQQVLDDCGADNVQAVQIGGPAGTMVARKDFSRQISFEDLSTGGSFLIFGENCDLLSVNQNFARFFAHESCGFCTPCRVGTSLLTNSLQKIMDGRATPLDIHEIKQLSALVKRYSHCGLGHTAANHILDSLQQFSERFEKRLTQKTFTPQIDLDAALAAARKMTGRDDADAHLE